MPNDAKLGFLVGVAGVVVAATLFFQNQQPAGPKAATGPATASTSLPSPGSIKPAKASLPVATSVAAPANLTAGEKRKEIEARPVSRAVDIEE